MSNRISLNRALFACSMIAALLSLVAPESGFAADDVHWRPAETRVFIASLCKYKGEKRRSFPVDERLDDKMAEFFIEKGVPEEQVKLLLDDKASVKHIQDEFSQCLSDSKPGELLIAYISGHGCPSEFCCFDGELRWKWFFDTIDKSFQGKQVLLILDCCFSGDPVDLAKSRKSHVNYACLSSTSHQVAYSGWRFAQCLMRAFEGNPVVDLNDDGHIELQELAEYTKHYMAFCANGMPMFATTHEFNPKLQLSRTEGKKHDRVGELIEVHWEDDWYKAEIIAVGRNGFRIHYVEDTKKDNDCNLTEEEIRPFKYTKYKVGAHVMVKTGDTWQPAEIVDTFDAICRCRLANEKPQDAHWYGQDRVRKK